MRRDKTRQAAAWVVIGLLALAPPATAGENETVSAFAAVETEAQAMPTGADTLRALARVSGPLFIDAGEGPMDAGDVLCFADIRSDRGRLVGDGTCLFTARDGARLFSTFNCEGVLFVGCSGDLEITGGSDRLAGTTGGGAFTMRTSETLLQGDLSREAATTTGRGVLFWKHLVLNLP